MVHQGALGDFIVSFPVLRSLRSSFVRIDGVCRSEFGRLAAHLAVIDRFHPLEAARFASLYTTESDSRVADLLKSYDHVLLFSFSETLEESVRRVKADAVHRIPPWPRDEEGVHVTEFLFQRLKASRLPLKPGSTAHPASGAPRSDAGHRRTSGSGSRVILCPGAGSRSKRWPLAGFLRLADRLSEMDICPEFVLGPAERDLESVFATGTAAVRRVHRPQGLVQLAQLLQSADGYVGNDSAVSHLAAFLGIPAVVLFGPSNPDRWRPLGTRVIVLKTGGLTDCRLDKAKTGCIDSGCVEQIPPEMVLKSLLGLIHP